MRRLPVAAGLRLTLATSTACLLACALLVIPTAAHAADPAPTTTSGRPATPDKSAKNAATVGLRTATAKGGDDRGVYDYEITPRGTVRDWVAVSNFRQQPITVRLFAKDATSSSGSSYELQASSTAPKDVGAWIALRKNKITIPARTEVVVPFQLGVPSNATPGDHSGGIVVSLLAQEPKPDGGTIVVDHRVAMRLHLRVPGDLKPALSIEKVTVAWNGETSVLGRSDAIVSYTVRNSGNVRMNASGGIRLGRLPLLPSVGVGAPPVEDLLPGGVARYTTVVKNVFGTGPMKATVSLKGVPQDTALDIKAVDATASTSFRAWAWLLIAVVIMVLIIGGLGGRQLQRRRSVRAADRAELDAVEERARASAKHRVLARAATAVVAPVVALVVALGAVLVPGLLAPAAAANGDEWAATITKTQGIALEPFDIQTSGGCPLPATAMVGLGYGQGFPKSGAVVVSNTEGNVTDASGFTAAPLDSMKNIMALQPDPRALSGDYRFVIRCITPEFPEKSYGEYVAAIRFDSRDHWIALPPPTDRKGPVTGAPALAPGGTAPAPSSPVPSGPAPSGGVPTGGVPTGAVPSGAVPSSAAAAAEPAAEPAQPDAQVASATADDSGSGGTWLTVGIGVLVVLAALALAFGRRLPGPWQRT